MSFVRVIGADRLSAQQLVDLLSAEGVNEARIEMPPTQTGRPGALGDLVTVLPQLSDALPIIFTAWVVSKTEFEFEIEKTDKEGRVSRSKFSFKKDDPVKVLNVMKDFFLT